MAKRKRIFTDVTIENRLKEGRGKGDGEGYKPWITVRDIPSTGISTEVLGWKTNRIHQLLSRLESSYFWCLEWSSVVVDIKEQYPLFDEKYSYDETVRIAETIGVKYPVIPRAGTYNVQTTDFVITLNVNNEIITLARTLKYEKDLSDRRTLEKFEIERLYWKKRKIDWKIVTERDINKMLTYNVELIHNYHNLKGLNLDVNNILYIESALKCELSNKEIGFSSLTQNIDVNLGLQSGTSLAVVKYLIANKFWIIDMNVKLNTEFPLKIIEFRELN
jgi:hypothetical protein